MIKIKIGIAPYKGEYEWDTAREHSTNEWRWIRQISGYMPLTIRDGWQGGDPSLFLALAVVMMVRAGRISRDQVGEVADELAEAPYDGEAITVVGDDVEDDSPLEQTTEPAPSSPSGSSDRPSGSGPDSKTDSGASAETLPPTTPSRSVTSLA